MGTMDKAPAKRIRPNPRYAHVERRLDTGNSVTRLEEYNRTHATHRARKGELYSRIRPETLSKMIVEYDNNDVQEQDRVTTMLNVATGVVTDVIEEEDEEPALEVEEAEDEVETQHPEPPFYPWMDQTRHAEHALIEDDAAAKQERIPRSNKPFLLLDTRTKEEYDTCHIVGAVNFPIAMLSRATNCFIEDIYRYQNKEGKVIIVYDAAERVAPKVATILIERGVTNVLMLSGGMRLLYQFCPDGLLVGTVPPTCFASTQSSRAPSRLNTGRLLSHRGRIGTGRSGNNDTSAIAMGRIVTADLNAVRDRLRVLGKD